MTPFFVLNQFLDYLSSEKRFSGHTVIAYENDLKQFFEFSEMDDLPKLAEINHQLIRSWLVNMIDTGLTNKTVNRKLSSLRSFVKWCQKNTFLDQNPFKKVVSPKISKRLPVFVKESDLDNEKLADYFSDDFKGVRNLLIVEIFYQTGIRLTELINMKISDIQNESIKVLGKRNKERIVPISNELSQKIKNYIVLRARLNTQEENLFIRENGKKIYEKLVYRIINIYLSSHTNLEKRSPHVLRHTFATHMMNNGVGLEVLKNLLGHANLTATQVYTHNSFSQLTNIYSQAHPRGQKKWRVMDIKVQAVHFTADQKLIDYVESKVSKLNLFNDHIVSTEVFLRLDNTTDVENKIGEVKIHLPGKELFAKKQAKSFEEAIDLASEALRKQVLKDKEKVS